MNKYQEAIDFFVFVVENDEPIVINKNFLENYKKDIQELINKETPMKRIIKNDDITKGYSKKRAYCPKCGNELYLYFSSEAYCCHCGQKLEEVEE